MTSREDVVVTSSAPSNEETGEDTRQAAPAKKRRFRPFKAVRRWFTVRRQSRYHDSSSKSRSSTEIAAAISSSDISDHAAGLPSKNFSMSADSVFTPAPADPASRPVDRRQARLTGALSIPEDLNVRRSLQSELFSKLKPRNISVDDGLPQSPGSSTNNDIMGDPLKRKAASFESEQSLYSVNSWELDSEFSCSPQTLSGFYQQRHHSTSSLDSSELDLDAVPLSDALDLSSARHKMAIRPKARRRPSTARKSSKAQAPTNLTSVREESKVKVVQATLPIQVTTTSSKTVGFDKPSDVKNSDNTSSKSSSKIGAKASSKLTEKTSMWEQKSDTKKDVPKIEVKVEKATTNTVESVPFVKEKTLEKGPDKLPPSAAKTAPGNSDEPEKGKTDFFEIKKTDAERKISVESDEIPAAGSVASRSKLFSQNNNNSDSSKSQPKSQSRRKNGDKTSSVKTQDVAKSDVILRAETTDKSDRSKRASAHVTSVVHSDPKPVNKRFSTVEPTESTGQPSWVQSRKKQNESEKTEAKAKPEVKEEVEKTVSTSEIKSLFEKPKDNAQKELKKVPSWKQQKESKQETKQEETPPWKTQLNKNRDTGAAGKGAKEGAVGKKAEAKKIDTARPADDKCTGADAPKSNKKVLDLMKNFQKVEVS